MERYQRPTLNDQQKKVNAAYASRKYKENMKKKGYFLLYIYVPKTIAREVRSKIRTMVDEFETKDN